MVAGVLVVARVLGLQKLMLVLGVQKLKILQLYQMDGEIQL